MAQAMTEKEVLTDLLIQEKESIKVYGTFIPEGSTIQIRDILQSNIDVIADQQFEVFEAMKNKGYYPLKVAQAQAINEIKQNFANS